MFCCLRDHVRQEQGLRRCILSHKDVQTPLRDHVRQEQGLRLISFKHFSIVFILRDHVRQEQGLRLYSVLLSECFLNFLRDHVRQEQGLRRRELMLMEPFLFSPRPCPSRTRIKTSVVKVEESNTKNSETMSVKNKD